MHVFGKLKIAGIFIALLLVISGCSSNAVPTTSPVKEDAPKQSQTLEEPETTAKKDTAPTPAPSSAAIAPTAAPAVVVTPAVTPDVAPAPTPIALPVVAPTPAAITPPVVAPAPPAVTPEPAPKQTPQAVTVYVTKTGKKYHLDGCGSLSQSKIPISLSEAKSKYGPCSVCNPPQ